MSANRDNSPLWHAVLGALMQSAVAVIVAAVGFLAFGRYSPAFGLFVGFFFASGFYYGREVTQRQAVLAKSGGAAVVDVWHLGWNPLRWHRSSQLDLLAPVGVTALYAVLAALRELML